MWTCDLMTAPPMAPSQPSLFPRSFDEMIAETGVSADEMAEWARAGLLSFTPGEARPYEPYEITEVAFLAGLFRSGLSRAYVLRLLAELPKPYRYDPRSTAYNFYLRAWQYAGEAEEPEFDDEFENFLEAAVMAGDVEALDDLVARARAARRRAEKNA